MYEEVQEVSCYRGQTTRVCLTRDPPQRLPHGPPPVIPQMVCYPPPFPPPAARFQPIHLAVYPTTFHHTSTAYLKVPHDRHGGSHRSANHKPRHPQRRGTSVQPPAPQRQPAHLTAYPNAAQHAPSVYLQVPRDRSGGSHRSANHDPQHPQRRETLVPYNNPNSVGKWAYGVQPGTPGTNPIEADVRADGSGSHRSGASEGQDQDRSPDEGKSRRGSAHPSARDHKSDGASRANGQYAEPSPHPNKLRKEPTARNGPTTRGSPSHHSHLSPTTRRR
jgi:hypothetical protein